MTHLPFDFSSTLEAFECPEPIEVYEKTGAYVNGYWTQTDGEKRTLYCILLNVDEETLEIVAQGRYVEAAFCIMFPEGRDTLYYTNQHNKSIQSKQSYAVIDGLEYVIKKNPETVKNAGFKSYYAIRFENSEDEKEIPNA